MTSPPYRTPVPRETASVSEGGIPVVSFFARAASPRSRNFLSYQVGGIQSIMPHRLCFGDACAPYTRLLGVTDSGRDLSMMGHIPDEGIEGRAFPYLPPADRNVVAPWRNLIARTLFPHTVVAISVLNASDVPRDIEVVIYGEFIVPVATSRPGS